jgi:uncharacterized protein (DUF927 family)
MYSLFRQSGLYREKWEREDYRNNTIARAIEVISMSTVPGTFHGGDRDRINGVSNTPIADPTKAKKGSTPGHGRFDVRADGVYLKSGDPKKPDLWICSKLEVIALARDDQNEKWARLIRFSDLDGKEHEEFLPDEILVDNGIECCRFLVRRGLRISLYRDVFVLPNETIGQRGPEIVRWEAPPEFEPAFKCRGSLDDWQREIGVCCSGNSHLVFCVSCAFAAPLLSLLGEESGGFHLTGHSSQGKTTALLLAGSVCGGGGKNGYNESWLTTKNALETVAEGHNDCLLCLDELSLIDPKDVGEAAYLLANGKGKARMTKDIAARQRLKWNLLFLSAGEISLRTHMKEAGKVIRGGQEVRVVEIAADAGKGFGLFEDIHGHPTSEAFARHLKDSALKYYGTPLREYLRSIILHNSLEDVKSEALRIRDEFITVYCPEGGSGEVSRVARRFAVVAAGGELATMLGTTGWPEGEATARVAIRFQSWLERLGTHGRLDEEAAIKQVRAIIEAHGASRFQVNNEPVRGRLGFIKDLAGQKLYCVLTEAFENEVCEGFDKSMVAQALDRRGHLHHDKGRLQLSVREGAGLVRVYAIKESLLRD